MCVEEQPAERGLPSCFRGAHSSELRQRPSAHHQSPERLLVPSFPGPANRRQLTKFVNGIGGL